MGQYYMVCNLDKKQFIHPHKFGDGLKLLEFGCSGEGTMTGLAILLSDGNGRGGGDLHSDNPIIGSWAGDRIVIAGDYADGGKFVNEEGTPFFKNEDSTTLYEWACETWQDISVEVLKAMADDDYIREKLLSTAKDSYVGNPLSVALKEAGVK